MSNFPYIPTTLLTTTYPAGIKTLTEGIIPNATPVTNAISTLSDTSVYAHVTIIEVLLPSGSDSRLTSTYDYDATITAIKTNYVVPITYTPYRIAAKPKTGHIARTVVNAILNPTDVATDSLASASSVNEPFLMNYCYTTTCSTVLTTATCEPTWAYPGFDYSSSSSSSNSDSDNYNDPYYCSSLTYYCGNHTLLIIAICVPICWVTPWLLIGLLESWLSFKGIMLGKQRKRGVPYAWCCISLLFLYCTGPTYMEKSREEQGRLEGLWSEMGIRRKLGLWCKWGFRST
ncbi:hypothetical protein OCU04_009752 [Sclerotinia nivalis]|uniref:Uncharacterized protein n=1 Tax=Sclerotinia nivalis TaxID=352851 RepID=A0A9X0DGF0_9HELO|nr:hypothetical protein OCU04_009752 [Sclerotinia nivalis]